MWRPGTRTQVTDRGPRSRARAPLGPRSPLSPLCPRPQPCRGPRLLHSCTAATWTSSCGFCTRPDGGFCPVAAACAVVGLTCRTHQRGSHRRRCCTHRRGSHRRCYCLRRRGYPRRREPNTLAPADRPPTGVLAHARVRALQPPFPLLPLCPRTPPLPRAPHLLHRAQPATGPRRRFRCARSVTWALSSALLRALTSVSTGTVFVGATACGNRATLLDQGAILRWRGISGDCSS
jgi:hypothetical protein